MTTSTIADGLVGLAVPIGSLTEDPRNVRVHGKRNMEIIRSSLSRFGQRVPLVARRETGVVIAGNARLAAARELGWSEVAVLYVEDDAATAAAYALVDNRSSDLSTFDQAGLAEVLATLQGVDLSLEEIGWDDNEVEEILGGTSSEEGGGAEETLPVPEPPKEPTTKPGDLILFGAYLECDACGKRQDYDPARVGEQCCDG